MRKYWMIFLSTLVCISFAWGQGKMTEFNAGLLAPSDAKSGFFGGINFGRMVDNNVGISLGIHVYHSSYTKKARVGEKDEISGQIKISKEATELDQSATLIPLYFQLHYIGPVSQSLDLKVTAGLGYELLWNNVTNFKTKVDKTQFFSGFGWNIGAGLSLPISRASDFYGELVWHGGSPSRDEGKTEEGLPVRSEIDMSGLGFRVGLRIYNFGL